LPEKKGIEPSAEFGMDISEAPNNSSIFAYLNLIKLLKSDYEIRIIIIIIANIKMFWMI
jgi:hypothetical protein